MASSKPCLLLTFHIILLLLVTSFADDQLIQQQCHNADVPETCIQCVQSDPDGQSADKIGIATIVINCLSNHDENLATDMHGLTMRARETSTRAIFEDCENGFRQSIDNISAANNKLKGGDYDQTNQFILAAAEPELNCKYAVKNLKELPSSVEDEMTVYEQLTDAALKIIDSF